MGLTRQTIRMFAVITLLFGALYGVYRIAYSVYTDRAEDTVLQRAELYRSTVVAALEQYEHLPFILAQDQELIAAALQGATQDTNLRLQSFAAASDLDAIYLMDTTGLTIAASNWDADLSFLGQNYGFRPYFRDAMAGRAGTFFAIGATTGRPGFFIAAPVYSQGRGIIGVVALKLDLNPLTTAWRSVGERVFVANARGVIVLSSDPDWAYQTLSPLTAQEQAEITAERQFGTELLSQLDPAYISASRFQTVTVPVGRMGWVLHYLSDIGPVQRNAIALTGLVALTGIILFAGVLFLRSRRIRMALAQSQEARRNLSRANTALAQEIADRHAAEQTLAVTQKELEQASRLAVLGQLSASVTHELGQPVAAMRMYLGSADLPDSQVDTESRDLLSRISGVLNRMEHIVGQLRFFAHPHPPGAAAVDMAQVLPAALDLMAPTVAERNVTVRSDVPQTPVFVTGDALRLEQVIINLLRNALDATQEVEKAEVSLHLCATDTEARVVIIDNGPGFADPDREIEPFFTTKDSGQGMGLGLAISTEIVRDHGGRLRAANAVSGGAMLTVTLPLRDEGTDV